MNKKDLIFVGLCILLFFIMSIYVWRAEVYKNNSLEICIGQNGMCSCKGINEIVIDWKNVLENNSS